RGPRARPGDSERPPGRTSRRGPPPSRGAAGGVSPRAGGVPRRYLSRRRRASVGAMNKKMLAGTAVMAALSLMSFQTPPSGSSGAPAGFSRFVDDFCASRFASRRTEGTQAGLHEYDAKMPDLSREAIEKRTAELHAELSRLQSFDPKSLSFDDAID